MESQFYRIYLIGDYGFIVMKGAGPDQIAALVTRNDQRPTKVQAAATSFGSKLSARAICHIRE